MKREIDWKSLAVECATQAEIEETVDVSPDLQYSVVRCGVCGRFLARRETTPSMVKAYGPSYPDQPQSHKRSCVAWKILNLKDDEK